MNKWLKIIIILSSVLILVGCGSTENTISMPKDSSYYENYEGTVDELVKELKKLGFNEINTIPIDYEGYQTKSIKEFELLGYGDWLYTGFYPGEEFYADNSVSIEYYNQCLNLTVDNCEDLRKILTDNTEKYENFIYKYDGKYIEFDGCVQTVYGENTGNPIFYLSGGDFSKKGYDGLLIQVDTSNVHISWLDSDVSINENVKEGQNVKVIGKVSRHYSEYHEIIYIEAVYLEYR